MNQLRRFYRNQNNGILFGVCAGLADYFSINVFVIRTIFLIPLLPLWITYLIMALVLEDNPLNVEQFILAEESFDHTLMAIQQQLHNIEQRVIHLEDYVTSEEFEFQCKLWSLDDKKP